MKECSVKETADILKATDNFVLTAHINSDGDAIGAVLALGIALEKAGKNVHLLIDDEVEQQYAFLPGIEKIKTPKDIIKTDMIVILDASELERIGRVAEYVDFTCILNIDHHVSNSGFCDFRLLDVKAAATCEIIFELLNAMSLTIDVDIAKCLYTGIASDCGFFRYGNTTAKTFYIASKLVDIGLQPDQIADCIEMYNIETLRTLPQILNTLEFYLGGKIASITIPNNLYTSTMDTEAFIKYPRYISGVEIALLFKEGVTDDSTRVSMRSKLLDVSKVALEFGGGGHTKASGCTVNKEIFETKKIIIEALARHMGVS